MSNTVPASFKPSGALVTPYLPAIPAQPTAPRIEQPAEQPKTWSFIDRNTGERLSVTCLRGCELDHSHDIATPTDPDDIWCQTFRTNVTLPINENGAPEEFRVLSITTNVLPFSHTLAYRMPHVSIEMIDDHWIEGLDPDGLETVINTLAERLDTMREAHAELIRARAEYRGRK
ncbi:DUF6907 domain-containing protein [Streptomyces flavidovirens]|uniref:DUF6907 domain-containing protein n=1 Tax=Streptomyces flavidovirens TaxID=67298 RepID=A0ABW6R925_9ACTN